jgi:hypothetical protein
LHVQHLLSYVGQQSERTHRHTLTHAHTHTHTHTHTTHKHNTHVRTCSFSSLKSSMVAAMGQRMKRKLRTFMKIDSLCVKGNALFGRPTNEHTHTHRAVRVYPRSPALTPPWRRTYSPPTQRNKHCDKGCEHEEGMEGRWEPRT